MSDTAEALIDEYASIPTPPSPPPSPLSTIRLQSSRDRLRAASPSTHHPSEIPSPPLLLPSTTHRGDLPEVDMPLRKIARFTAPTGRFEVGESSSTIVARQAGHTLAHTVDYRFIDTMDASIRASESRAMTAVGVVNDRVTDLAATQRQDAQELYVRCEDAQDERALLGAQAMEAYIRALQRDVDVLQRQRIKDEDRLTTHIKHEHERFKELIRIAEVGPQDGPKDAGSSCVADALAEHDADRSRNGDDSHDFGTSRRRQVKGTDVLSYNQRFQELALMCDRMFPEESDEVEKYVGGLPDMIYGSMKASKPKTMQEAIKFATELMDKKILTLAECQAENKRKFEDSSRNNQNQQQPFKRNNVARAYTTRPGEKKP
ncbi:hypothetical protein Tco_0209645 [Tanacetum coccineum]